MQLFKRITLYSPCTWAYALACLCILELWISGSCTIVWTKQLRICDLHMYGCHYYGSMFLLEDVYTQLLGRSSFQSECNYMSHTTDDVCLQAWIQLSLDKTIVGGDFVMHRLHSVCDFWHQWNLPKNMIQCILYIYIYIYMYVCMYAYIYIYILCQNLMHVMWCAVRCLMSRLWRCWPLSTLPVRYNCHRQAL